MMTRGSKMKNNYNGRNGNGYQPLKSPAEILMGFDRAINKGKLSGLLIGSAVCLPVLLFLVFN